MLRVIRTYQGGVYIRRQIFYLGNWVNLQGLSLLPVGQPPRRWLGLAWESLAAEPKPTPKVLTRHDRGATYLVYYNPRTHEDLTPVTYTRPAYKGYKVKLYRHKSGLTAMLINKRGLPMATRTVSY